MSATLVVTNEAFELLWRSQSYCFMTPTAVENLRSCHARFLASKSLHGTKCRTMVRKYWRHVPLPQPPEFNHGANMCMIDLSTWPAPPPDAVEVIATDCTIYHLDKDFVLWTVHPADQPEAMVHSIRVLEIARLIQWMKPRQGPHPHPKSRTLVVLDGSDMTILATYPPGVMQTELPLGSSVFEIVSAEDRDSFAEQPPTKLYVPNAKDHGKTKRTFNAVPIVLLDGYLFVMEEADEADPSAAVAESMVSSAAGRPTGFQQLSALIREDASTALSSTSEQPGPAVDEVSMPVSSSSSLVELQPQPQQQQHEPEPVASPPTQTLPPPAHDPQWPPHPPPPTVPVPTLCSKSSSTLPSWQLPPLPKYRDPLYSSTNPSAPTPALSDPSTRSALSTIAPASSTAANGAESSHRIHHLPRIPPQCLPVPSSSMPSRSAAPRALYESPPCGRTSGPGQSASQVYPPLLSPLSSYSSTRFDSSGPSTCPSQPSTSSTHVESGDASWYRETQRPYSGSHSGASARYPTFDAVVPEVAGDQNPYPPIQRNRSSTYHQPQFAPVHEAANGPREVYFEPPVYPAPRAHAPFTHAPGAQPPPGLHLRSMPQLPNRRISDTQPPFPHSHPSLPLSRRGIGLPPALGHYESECFGLQRPEEHHPSHQQQQLLRRLPVYANNAGYPRYASASAIAHRPRSPPPRPIHGHPHHHLQLEHHPPHYPADFGSSQDDHRPTTYSGQAPSSTSRVGAWLPQYPSGLGRDPYAQPGECHAPPPPPLFASRMHCPPAFGPATSLYPLQHASQGVEGSGAQLHEQGYVAHEPGDDQGYGYGYRPVVPHLPQPYSRQQWHDCGHHHSVYESGAHDVGRASQGDQAPERSELSGVQYGSQQHGATSNDRHALAHMEDQGDHQGVGQDDDEEDTPILDIRSVSRVSSSTPPGGKRSNSSRVGQRLSGKRKRGISPPLSSAVVKVEDGQGSGHGGGSSVKFIDGCVNPRYPMRPSPHGVPCARCGMLESPEWRRGEAGIRDLCNACGLKYYREKKQREKVARRAAAVAAAAAAAGPLPSPVTENEQQHDRHTYQE